MIKLIIFDLDGVLVDTEDIHYRSLTDAIHLITNIDIDVFSHLLIMDGKTTKFKLDILRQTFNLTDEQIDLIDNKKQKNVLKYFYETLCVDSEQCAMLDRLSNKYVLAIASNSRKENVLSAITISGIFSFFSTIMSNNDVINHKPDPEMFLKVMEKENTIPSETLILEDSYSGRIAALASGAHLLSINSITDVTLENIQNAINQIQTDNSSPDGRDGDTIH